MTIFASNAAKTLAAEYGITDLPYWALGEYATGSDLRYRKSDIQRWIRDFELEPLVKSGLPPAKRPKLTHEQSPPDITMEQLDEFKRKLDDVSERLVSLLSKKARMQ